MGRGRFLALLLFVFIFADASNASKYRILIGETPIDNPTVPGNESRVLSPPRASPTPVTASGGNGSDPNPVDDPNKNKTTTPATAKTPISDPVPKGSANNTKKGEGNNPQTETEDPVSVRGKGPKEDPKLVPETGSKTDTQPAPTTPKGEKKGEPVLVPSSPGGGKEESTDAGKEKKNDKDKAPLSPNADKESCNGAIKTCEVKAVIACIKNFDSGSRKVTILIQNTGGRTLNATLSADNTKKILVIFKHRNEEVNVALGIDKSNKIMLNAGNGECDLTMDPPISEDNFFRRFPSREKLVTPINGAYLLIATVLIFGGTWACCMVRKRKQRAGGGVPYQELEMGVPESASATAVETAEGWDQGWDDDWDGDNAVKSPGGHIAGSISSNGLTSRSTNKDGWENDWDD